MDEFSTKRRKSLPRNDGFIRKRKITAKVTLSAASRLLGKKFSSSSDLMNPCKLWMHTIPTQDCDVLFTFPPNTADHTLMWLLSCLRMRLPELGVHVRHHTTSGVYGFYLTASYEYLLKGAEDLRIRKRLKSEFGGGLREFIFDEQQCFEGVENPKTFLTSQERQFIVLHVLHAFRAIAGDELNDVKFVEGQAIVPKCVSEGIISQVLPLHNEETVEELRLSWVRAFLKPQPLDRICEYFGVKIAVYFAWLGHYTFALTVPAFFGIFLWLFILGKNQSLDDVCFVVFALFNVLWATLYLESWKRYCAELAYRWGTLDNEPELIVEPRPLFRGELAMSPVTGRLEPTYPAWKRSLFRYCVSLPVILLCLGVVLISMLAILELQEWWDKFIDEYKHPFWLKYLPKILLALVINILDVIYQKIAVWLNDQENYRLEATYENHLIIKIAVFQFVNSFLSLFYIAFYLQDMDRLREQLATLLITRQVIGNIRESCIPFIMEQFNLARMSVEAFGAFSTSSDDNPASHKATPLLDAPTAEPVKATNGSPTRELKMGGEKEVLTEPTATRHTRTLSSDRNLSQAEVESSMYKYDGTFEDYLEMFIQFGYVILFSSAFPMAGMCALLNNIVEVRSDAFKLCCIFQRPFGQRVNNIGTWQEAMEIMGIIAVMVNCALIGMSGQIHRLFPGLGTAGTIILVVILEHLTLSLKQGIAHAIPDIPEWVATEMAKIEYKRRLAVKKLARTRSGSSLVLRNTAPLLPHSQRELFRNHISTQTDPGDLENPLASSVKQLVKSKLGERMRRDNKKKGTTGSPRHRPLSDGIAMTLKQMEGLVTPVSFPPEGKDGAAGDFAGSKLVPSSDGLKLEDELARSAIVAEAETKLCAHSSPIRGTLTVIDTDELVQPPPAVAPRPRSRFSPPTLKLKGFRRFSLGHHGNNSTHPKTSSNWSGNPFHMFRKSFGSSPKSSTSVVQEALAETLDLSEESPLLLDQPDDSGERSEADNLLRKSL